MMPDVICFRSPSRLLALGLLALWASVMRGAAPVFIGVLGGFCLPGGGFGAGGVCPWFPAPDGGGVARAAG